MAEVTSTELWAAFGVNRPSIGRRAELVRAALEAGHEPSISRSGNGKRVKFVCSCGFSTPANWTLKHAKDAAIDHVIRAGRTALGESPLLGEIGAHGVSDPESVGPPLEDSSNVVSRA